MIDALLEILSWIGAKTICQLGFHHPGAEKLFTEQPRSKICTRCFQDC